MANVAQTFSHQPNVAVDMADQNDVSPVQEVHRTVPTTDNPDLPVLTVRVWFLGIISCVLLSFLNSFFRLRTEPFLVSLLFIQLVTLPMGKFLAKVLPTTKFHIPGTKWEYSLNPGPFNVKEHVLISTFANAGTASSSGTAYAIGIVNIIKVFYHRRISFITSWILVISTQVLAYGLAGIMRKFVVKPAHMWWPNSLVQVSLFRTLHEKDNNPSSRGKFFLIAFICSFVWYIFPRYLLPILTTISWVCWAFPKSVTAHQIGSGMEGLGVGSFSLDWSTIASYLGSPLIAPKFTIFNILVGYIVTLYIVIPIAYYVLNVYNAQKFPIFSAFLFNSKGKIYDVSAIVDEKFEINLPAYEQHGPIHLSIIFSLAYGFSFAAVISTYTHVVFFHGREILSQCRASFRGNKVDIHTKLMKKYKDIPNWWFYLMLGLSLLLSLLLSIFMKDQIQLPWWGVFFAFGLALTFTLPLSIITATTNQAPTLDIVAESIMGSILPGRPIANVCFKTYGCTSVAQAICFLNDFKLSHYMKIPPISMFLVQFAGTMIAGTINLSVAWWLLHSVKNICQRDMLPHNTPWQCPNDQIIYDASVIWGLIGPKRIFGSLGHYSKLTWFFLGGALGPIIVWLLHKAFPHQRWIRLINLPVAFGAVAIMPRATALNFNSWIAIGIIFNYFILKYKKCWLLKSKHYLLSAALDGGSAIMAVLMFFALETNRIQLSWWGSDGEHCELAKLPKV